MAVTTSESFLAVLQKSKLLTREQLGQARSAAGQIADAKAFARKLVERGLLTRWQAGQLLAGRSAFFLGKYKLIDLLGRGGMGSVFLVEHTTMNRPVALKIIAKNLGKDPESLERFFTEARAIAALNHPNIVHAYDVDSEGERYYIAMEFVQGQDLQRMVEARGPLDFAQAADYIRQAAEGLAHAHQRDMVHCDIKPANLLTSRQGVVKILDMGMARLVGRDRGPAAEQDERVLGTVDYLAPEQALDSPQMDHRADLYSLGCTLYFLLTGRPPFPEGTLHERILKHQTQQPRPIVELRPDAPKDLVEICRKMMAKEPDDRFQTAGEVAGVLAEWHPPERKLRRAEPLGDAQTPAKTVAAASPSGGASSVSSADADDDEDAMLVEVQGSFFFEHRRLLLSVGLGAVAGLILLVGVIALVASRRGDAPGDQQGVAAGSASETAQTAGDSDILDQPEESFWDDVVVPDQAADASSGEGAKTQADKAGAAQGSKKQTAKKPGASKTTAKKPETKKPAAKPAPKKTEEADDVKPPPAKSKAEKPAAEKAEPDMPASGDKGDEKPAGDKPGESATAAAPAEKTEPEKPEAEKPEPKMPAKKDPFAGLPEVVELSRFSGGTAEPVELGKILAAPGEGLQLSLLGGEKALKSTRQTTRTFVLNQAGADSPQGGWTVQLEQATAGGDTETLHVASLRREGEALVFQWADEADPSSANYLRNCILQVQVGQQSRDVRLVGPEPVEPVSIDLVRGATTVTTPVEWLPDTSSLRAEITQVEGREDYRVEPAGAVEPGTVVGLFFDRTDRDGNTADGVEFRVVFTARSSGLTCKLQLVKPPATQFRKLQSQNVATFKNMFAMQQDEVLKKLNPIGSAKPPGEEELARLTRQLGEIETGLWYVEFFEQTHQNAKLHFRLYTEVDGHELVLASTGGAATEASE